VFGFFIFSTKESVFASETPTNLSSLDADIFQTTIDKGHALIYNEILLFWDFRSTQKGINLVILREAPKYVSIGSAV
jgi:hypothetical protein